MLEDGPGFLGRLVERIAAAAGRWRSSLVFTGARALAERLGWALRRRRPDWDKQVAVHHSALAAVRREEIEGQFKAGRLRLVVSTTSLELGVDIGPVDLVVLVHPPGDVVRLLQRLGRSGHQPGRIRRGLILAANASELLTAAVTTASCRAGQCEPLHVCAHPLDVLCQQICGLAATGWCAADDLFALVRQAYPYRDLKRADFDDCLAYLLGLDASGAQWLPARLRGTPASFTIRDSRTARLLRRNLGVIVEDEPVAVQQLPPAGVGIEDVVPVPVGQVDFLFADQLQPGDRFLLDGRCLQVRQRTAEGLWVEETVGRPAVPRWGGEGLPLAASLADRLFALRVQAAEAVRDGPAALGDFLRHDFGLSAATAGKLVDYFHAQETISEIPQAGVCLIEVLQREQCQEFYIHTPINRAANEALARVLVFRLIRDHGWSAMPIAADLGLALLVRGSPLATEENLASLFRTLLAAEGFSADLDAALSTSSLLRERFQRVSMSGLMLLRNPLGRRRRVGGRAWGESRLFDQVVSHDTGFVLLRQARKEVCATWCNASAARDYVERLPTVAIHCRYLARQSPFAEHWTQAAVGEAGELASPAEALRRLHATLMNAAG
jgi:ATP-dependent Lhr-like helicase